MPDSSAISTIAGIILASTGFEAEWLNAKVFAIFHDNFLLSATGAEPNAEGPFKIIEANVTSTIIGILFILGAMLVSFSKESRTRFFQKVFSFEGDICINGTTLRVERIDANTLFADRGGYVKMEGRGFAPLDFNHNSSDRCLLTHRRDNRPCPYFVDIAFQHFLQLAA